MSEFFDGDFDLLPLRSLIEHGPVPEFPTDNELIAAQDDAAKADPMSWSGAALVWRAEAVRFRRLYSGEPLNLGLALIKSATAKRLARMQLATLAA